MAMMAVKEYMMLIEGTDSDENIRKNKKDGKTGRLRKTEEVER